MLTLFPRIKPNLPAPPPASSPEPKAFEAATPDEPSSLHQDDRAAISGSQTPAATADDEHVRADEAQIITAVTPEDHNSATFREESIQPLEEALSGFAGKGRVPFVIELTCECAEPTSKGDDELGDSASQAAAAELPATPSSTHLILQSDSTPALTAPPADDVAADVQGSTENSDLQSAANGQLIESGTASGSGVPLLSIAATNIFDELDILHEAAAESVSAVMAEPPTQIPPEVTVTAVTETAIAEQELVAVTEPASVEAPPPKILETEAPAVENTIEQIAAPQSANSADTELVDEVSCEMASAQAQESDLNVSISTGEPEPQSPIEQLSKPEEEVPAAEVLVTSAAPAEAPGADILPPEAIQPASTIDANESSDAAPTKATAPARPIPRKPKHAKGRFFQLERVPEPEAMEDSDEVEAYASAAAQAHLDAIDDTFVAHAQLLVNGRERGRALDIGTGPGQIVIKLGTKLTRWKFVGIDRSAAMIQTAREALANTAEVAGRVDLQVADGNSLDFPDASFDLVICNSVLHHMAEPQNLFSEIARVVKPGGAILLRDLRRPSRFKYGFHIRKHGKHYKGEMRRLYVASVQAAYTEEELQKMVGASALRDVRVFRHGKTHIGFERPLGNRAPSKHQPAKN